MKYPETVVGAVIFNPENKVLICRSTKWNSKYIIPGGHIESGEKMEEALVREVKEETGLEIYDIELLSLKESIYDKSFGRQKHFIFIDYICKTDFCEVKLNDEADVYEWISLKELDDYDLEDFVKNLLEELRDKNELKYKTEIFYKNI
ncbi:NUDIX domain-containing protein [Halanaerobium congolense]|jgi:nucleoside triphosphatase|uniref:NUDIX domain-containing protein n=1 Tax=Halanaerobium congolense TaxID=54121 RepID=A0A1M7NLI0_9FIRM|nr:NUDIX domain-containing protein [Halanaerobium congolense]PTX15592.1 nucleoside triphosphatase [Halanaerobium congolense]PXV62413.1 nucleoside triphosphatase [Halanaerobium congolense]SDF91543.1 NUDIX domain-containing protein [Halanaerobium congolense]SDK95417.1 NUDIX domain-containing protein [Halanaerobium congolense]SDM91338.1 NUDIX domain-containing protein [Halanaerobium congolense]